MATDSGSIRLGSTRAASDRSTRRSAANTLPMSHPAALLGFAVTCLLVLGLVMILSASSVSTYDGRNYGSSFLFFKKQLIWAMIGVAAYFFFARVDYHRLRNFGYASILVVGGLLLAVLIPGVGITVGGSARWLGLGPLSFQPSEFAKLALILFAADVFSRKKERSLQEFSQTALPMIPVMGALTILVMLQPDMGTTMILGMIGFGILFVAGTPLRYVVGLGSVGAALATLGAVVEPYRRARLLAFLDPWADPLNTGYHTIQSLIALGSGGWFGVGLGASRQKWSYIPNSHTDFIFAILGEEMGLLGTLTVVGLFAFLVYLGVRIARKAPDRHGMLLATGISIWIGGQALVNIGAVTATMPVTGVPLPLVSFGGTSLVICLAAMGILTNIGMQARPSRGGKSKSDGTKNDGAKNDPVPAPESAPQ